MSVVLSLVLVSGPFAPQAQGQEEPLKMKVNVDLLLLPVVVVGDNGRLVSELSTDNFTIALCPATPEVGKKKSGKKSATQPCTTFSPEIFDKESLPPARIWMGADESGSTKESLAEFTKPSVVKMIRVLIPQETNGPAKAEDKYMLWSFYETQRRLVGEWTQDANAAEEALSPIQPQGGSAIFDTIYLAAKEEMRRTGEFTKIMILVTDGVDTWRSLLVDPATDDVCPPEKRSGLRPTDCRTLEASDVIYALQEAKTTLYVIDFSQRHDWSEIASSFQLPFNTPDDLGEIAKLSGGERFAVKNNDEARKAADDILERISKRYILGVYTKSLPCGWYKVEVGVGELQNGEFKVNKNYTKNAVYPELIRTCK